MEKCGKKNWPCPNAPLNTQLKTEMGGLLEERFGRSGSGERERGMGGVETDGGYRSEMGSVTEERKKSTTNIGARLTLDFKDKEESNNNNIKISKHEISY